jgi:nucleoid-associated protein YgaU
MAGKEVKIGLAVIVGLLVLLGVVIWTQMRPSDDASEPTEPVMAATGSEKAPAKEDKRPAFSGPSKAAQELTASDPFGSRSVPPKKAVAHTPPWGSPVESGGKHGQNDRVVQSSPPSFMPKPSDRFREKPDAAVVMGGDNRTANPFPAEPAGGEVTVGEGPGPDPFQSRRASPATRSDANPGVASLAAPPQVRASTDPFGQRTATAENPLRGGSMPTTTAPSPSLAREPIAANPTSRPGETPLAGVAPPRVLSAPDAPRHNAAPVTIASGRAGGRVYVVREGDTLYDIARTELGKASRWGEIYDLNWDQLGNRLDALAPGMKLVLPADSASQSEAMTRNPGPATVPNGTLR